MKRTNPIIPIVAAVLLVVLLVVDCERRSGSTAEPQPSVTLRGQALGTLYQITVVGSLPDNFQPRLDSLFEAANNSMSIFRPNSLLSRINRDETDLADEHIIYCIELARHASELSSGRYDITIRPLVEAYGFAGKDANYKINRDSLLEFIDYRLLSTDGLRIIKADSRVSIDLNSIAKGATVDMAARLIESTGAENYLVDIGGEIFCRGTNPHGQPWRIGVETPFEGNFSLSGEHISQIISVSEVGMATSGNYRNFRTDSEGNKYTHIINPLTGENTASSLLSATVIAESCALADAYGTMFMSLGLEEAKRVALEENIAALFIYDEGGRMRTFTTPQMRPYTK